MTEQKLKKLIQALSLPNKQHLLSWLAATIQQEEAELTATPAAKQNRELVDRQQIGNVIYQLEMVKCGKEGCKCTRGHLHGPYWYSYQRQGKTFKSRYIGKVLKVATDDQI